MPVPMKIWTAKLFAFPRRRCGIFDFTLNEMEFVSKVSMVDKALDVSAEQRCKIKIHVFVHWYATKHQIIQQLVNQPNKGKMG